MKKIFYSFTFLLISISAFAQIPPGAVGYYMLDGHPYDSSGLNNHGNYIGTVTPSYDRWGNPGGASYFDGISGHIDMGDDPDFQLTDSISISAWINPIMSNDWKGIASKWSGFGSGGYYLGINPQTNRVRFNLDMPTPLEGTPLQYGVWTHVVATFDGNTMKMYENGNMVASTIWNTPIANTIASFFIGTQFDLPANKFLGSIDEVIVYGRVLDSAEVIQLITFAVSVTEATNAFSLAVYPNPANDLLQIRYDEIITPGTISIKNILGKEVLSTTATGRKTVIDISSFAKGVYVVDVQSGEKQSRKKIVVQ